jgi:hypothetical protein
MDPVTKLVSGRLKAEAPTGPHPGAELLAAFAENALPEADRGQLLQHLGGCSDCREILYLALPDSPQTQKVLVPQLRPFTFRHFPFSRWALGWGAVVASVAIVAIVGTNRLGHRNQTALKIAAPPPSANEVETKIAADKAPQELDQLQAARDAIKPKMALTRERNETKPQPEAKHMTGKMQSPMVFDDSGQVHMGTPAAPASSLGGPVRNDKNQKDEPAFAGFNGAPAQSRSDEKVAIHGYANAAAAPAKAKADQPTIVGEAASVSANSTDELESLPIDSRNAAGPAPLARKAATSPNLGGTILDPSGAGIRDAKITAFGPGGEKTTTSDSKGRFSFDRLDPGPYSIKAEATGFKPTEIKQVAVLSDKPSALRVRLEVGSSSEAVEVTAGAADVESNQVAGATPAAESSTGLVAAQRQTAAQLNLRKAADSEQPDAGSATGSGAAPLQWTLSPEGAVQRSGDSGKSWQTVSLGAGTTFRALSAVGANIWVGGKAGALYHSTDSGQTWVKFEPVVGGKKLDQDIVHLDFSDALSGKLNTANGEVWTTSDGGRNWASQVAH